MSALQNTDDEVHDSQASEKEEGKDKEEEKNKDVRAEADPTSDKGDEVEEEPENIYISEAGERIKSMKSGLGLIIVNESDKKLTEGVKADVDKSGKCNSGSEEDENVPPELPPRPPPRLRQPCTCVCELDEREIQERNERK